MYLLVELFLIFVPITLFALWQIRAVRRSQAEANAKKRKKPDLAGAPRHPERQHRLDDG